MAEVRLTVTLWEVLNHWLKAMMTYDYGPFKAVYKLALFVVVERRSSHLLSRALPQGPEWVFCFAAVSVE